MRCGKGASAAGKARRRQRTPRRRRVVRRHVPAGVRHSRHRRRQRAKWLQAVRARRRPAAVAQRLHCCEGRLAEAHLSFAQRVYGEAAATLRALPQHHATRHCGGSREGRARLPASHSRTPLLWLFRLCVLKDGPRRGDQGEDGGGGAQAHPRHCEGAAAGAGPGVCPASVIKMPSRLLARSARCQCRAPRAAATGRGRGTRALVALRVLRSAQIRRRR